MSDVMEMLCDNASRTYFNLNVLNNKEYEDIRKQILQLQEKYKEIDLTEEQRDIIDNLLKANDELNEEAMQIMYHQGLIDCVGLLKELRVLS